MVSLYLRMSLKDHLQSYLVCKTRFICTFEYLKKYRFSLCSIVAASDRAGRAGPASQAIA